MPDATLPQPPEFTVDDVGNYIAGAKNRILLEHLFGDDLNEEELTSLRRAAILSILDQHGWFGDILEERHAYIAPTVDDPNPVNHELAMCLLRLKFQFGHTVRLEPVSLATI